jgi:hypothetical protein
MELSSFINNRNKYHFFFQTKIAKIFDWKQLVQILVNIGASILNNETKNILA